MPMTVANPAARTGLRPLNGDEEGYAFSKLPAGVYGFTYAPLSESPLFSKDNYHSFEMQKHPDGSGRLIGWVTPGEAQSIREGHEFLDIYVYPEKWQEAAEQVSLPIERTKPRNRNPVREDGNRLAVTISPSKG
jgi:hypothetical protein